MKVELEQHTGIRRDGLVVEFKQWRVFATGPEGARLLIGYLSHDESMPIMLLCNQPDNILREIIEKCEAITKRKVIPPRPMTMPPEIDNSAGNDDQDYEDDEDD